MQLQKQQLRSSRGRDQVILKIQWKTVHPEVEAGNTESHLPLGIWLAMHVTLHT